MDLTSYYPNITTWPTNQVRQDNFVLQFSLVEAFHSFNNKNWKFFYFLYK